MREIEFRGKSVEHNMWVYGYYIKAIGSIIVEKRCSISTMEYVVDENSVGQFTGLRDKNGVKIYEGDIVCSRFPEGCEHAGKICSIGDIQFRDGMFGIEWTQWKNDTFWGIRRLDEDFHKEIEVIGNIFDNPELIKESNNEKL